MTRVARKHQVSEEQNGDYQGLTSLRQIINIQLFTKHGSQTLTKSIDQTES